MPVDCEFVRDNIDAWALGALDGDDARALETHLEDCTECQTLRDQAQETAASLGLGVPLVAASDTLKARVIATASVLDDISNGRAVRRPRWIFVATAAAVIAGVGLVGWSGYLQSRVQSLDNSNAQLRSDARVQSAALATADAGQAQAAARSADLASTQDAVVEVLAQPDIARMPMAGTGAAPGSSGHYIWSKTGEIGALVARGLPPLDADKSYCMWIVYSNAWVQGGLFNVDADGTGRLVVRDPDGGSTADRGQFVGFAVTIEPSTGTTKHTGDTVLVSVPPL